MLCGMLKLETSEGVWESGSTHLRVRRDTLAPRMSLFALRCAWFMDNVAAAAIAALPPLLLLIVLACAEHSAKCCTVIVLWHKH
jgi:hypothetical protein